MEYRHPFGVSQTGPNFAASIPTNGYSWWYLDALSDCGRHGLTIIAMLGCVFSPWYAAARRRGPADPLEHSALNVALYGAGGRRWALTERGRRDVHRDYDRLSIGPSSLAWDGTKLHIDINEITSPLPSRLRGRVTLQPSMLLHQGYPIDRLARHLWTPISPHCTVEVAFERPTLSWRGVAYFDSNEGRAPLEADFASWNWSRATAADQSRIFYDTAWRSGGGRSISLSIDARGRVEHVPPPPQKRLPSTLWGIPRETRCDAEAIPRLISTFESGPFYARSLIETSAEGRSRTAFHESVSLQRFSARWVQALLPVRLPRRRIRR